MWLPPELAAGPPGAQSMATAAAVNAAISAISVTCQPVMPPCVTMRTGPEGTGMTPAPPEPGTFDGDASTGLAPTPNASGAEGSGGDGYGGDVSSSKLLFEDRGGLDRRMPAWPVALMSSCRAVAWQARLASSAGLRRCRCCGSGDRGFAYRLVSAAG